MNHYNDDEPVDGFSDTHGQGEFQGQDVRDNLPNPPDSITDKGLEPLSPDETEKLREEADAEEEEESTKA